MGLLNVNVFESSVALSGVQDYARSDGERPISAHVAFDQLRALDLGASPLALFIPLAGVRLLGLMRREPQYAEPVATILSLAGAALLPDDCDAANFRMRDVVVTDPDALGTFVGAGLNMSVAEMNSSIPVVEPQTDRPVERQTRILLVSRRSNGRLWASFKFPMKSANPLITASALFATIEQAARHESFERVTQPAAAGLVMLARMSEKFSDHTGFDPSTEAQANDLLTRMIVEAEPVGIAIATLEPSESPEATSPNLGHMGEDEIREAAERLGVKPPPESSN